MALRQRPTVRGAAVLPLQRPSPPISVPAFKNGNGSSRTIMNGSGITVTASLSNAFTESKRKLRRSNNSPSVFLNAYLPLIGFFCIAIGCAYLVLGGGHHHHHDHRSGVHSGDHSNFHSSSTAAAATDERIKPHIYRRKLTTEDDQQQRPSSGLRDVDTNKDQDAWLEREKKKLEAEREKREEEFTKQKEQLRMERKMEEELLEEKQQELVRVKEEERKEELALKQEEERLHLTEFKKHDAENWMQICERKVRDEIASSPKTEETAMHFIEDLTKCAEEPLTKELVKLNEEVSQQGKVRMDIAGKLENYTCADPNAPITPDVSTHTWTLKDGTTRQVHVKHDRPASQVHVVEKFIDHEECMAMEAAASKSLHRATVANGKGGSQYSDNRKAMQAGIRVPWQHEEQGDPIARLSRRVYDYANHVTGLNIDEHGQEDLMSIQYFGRGKDDEHPDRYMPHCDGGCTGLPFRNGTRMATMVVYCTLPEIGGSTNFRNAGVHVKPTKGAAIFFSYMDPKTFLTDDRYTEHSGCPVYEGEKKIVTQWIRYGVDEENPWNSYNTMGIKLKEASEYE